ncbi:hypothetical protein E4U21_002821 [Claviceps maximensis]|nr:hypothetical protein E4U21_002821 [Claviceps maximensis]
MVDSAVFDDHLQHRGRIRCQVCCNGIAMLCKLQDEAKALAVVFADMFGRGLDEVWSLARNWQSTASHNAQLT